jgi:transketolase C-terminal domain/subunit
MLRTALDSQKMLLEKDIKITVVAVSHFSDRKNHIKQLIDGADRIFALESHRRECGFGSFISSIGLKSPVRIGVRHYLQSSRDFQTMVLQHELGCDTVCAVVKKVLTCEHNKKN